MRFLILAAALPLSMAYGAPLQAPSTGPNQWGVVDGSKTPELIQDIEAWKMLFQILSDCSGCPSRDVRAAYLDKIGLSEDELAIVLDAANAHRLVTNDVLRRFQKSKMSNPRPYSQAVWAQMIAPFAELDVEAERQRKFLERELSVTSFQNLERLVKTKVKAESSASAKVK